MTRENHLVGHYEGGNSVYGMLYIQEQEISFTMDPKKSRRYFYVRITFEQKYTKQELDSKNIPLPFYTRNGKSWYMTGGHTIDIVMKELQRLQGIGFKIPNLQKNSGLLKFTAGRV